MAAHPYWRLTGFLTDSNALELSQAQLYDGAQLIAQAPTFTVPPTTGMAFPDTLRWDDCTMPGFTLMWHLATPVDSPALRLGAGSSANNFPREFYCQYSDDGLFWTTGNAPVNIAFPGAGSLTDEPGSETLDTTPARLFTGMRKGFWYDPSDLNTLFQDTAGTAPLTATGQTVRKVLDKSGRGAHCYAMGSVAPTLQRETDGRYYLDMTNGSCMSTDPIDFTGTDKITAFMGVLLTATGTGMLLEVSSNINANPGTLYLVHSEAASGDLSMGNRGDASVDVSAQTTPYEQPNLAVLTARYTTVGAKVDEMHLRRNAIETPLAHGSSSSDSGSGNYGNYPVYISSRGNSGLFATMRMYGVILLGDSPSDAELASAEYFINAKTGAYALGANPDAPIPFIPLSPIAAAQRWRTTSTAPNPIGGDPLPIGSVHGHLAATPYFDAYHGGVGIIYGTVKEQHAPADTPWRRRVLLIDERSRLTVRETWSDPATGAYEFRGIREGVKYTVLSYDHTGQYGAAVGDNITPEIIHVA